MRTIKLNQQSLNQWVDDLILRQSVVGVQAKGDCFEFAPLRQAADLRLDYDIAILPPKMFFQPAREPLVAFDGAAGYRTLLAAEPFILLGVHPYDLEAILQMDILFTADADDIHYRSRREKAVIVACDVRNPSPNCFAGCMDTAVIRHGFDVLLTRVADEYVAEAGTEAGAALLAACAEAPEADVVSLARREQVWLDNRKLLRKHDLKVALKELPGLLERSYDHPVWEEKARRCFSCGSCNLVCPTCYCFDVQDEVGWDLKRGVRSRTWDGCLLKDFATVSGGHNFRKNRAERYRHRYYRKGKYMPDKIGRIACVGCGRCVSACVSKIANPVEVYNRLLEGA